MSFSHAHWWRQTCFRTQEYTVEETIATTIDVRIELETLFGKMTHTNTHTQVLSGEVKENGSRGLEAAGKRQTGSTHTAYFHLAPGKLSSAQLSRRLGSTPFFFLFSVFISVIFFISRGLTTLLFGIFRYTSIAYHTKKLQTNTKLQKLKNLVHKNKNQSIIKYKNKALLLIQVVLVQLLKKFPAQPHNLLCLSICQTLLHRMLPAPRQPTVPSNLHFYSHNVPIPGKLTTRLQLLLATVETEDL